MGLVLAVGITHDNMAAYDRIITLGVFITLITVLPLTVAAPFPQLSTNLTAPGLREDSTQYNAHTAQHFYPNFPVGSSSLPSPPPQLPFVPSNSSPMQTQVPLGSFPPNLFPKNNFQPVYSSDKPSNTGERQQLLYYIPPPPQLPPPYGVQLPNFSSMYRRTRPSYTPFVPQPPSPPQPPSMPPFASPPQPPRIPSARTMPSSPPQPRTMPPFPPQPRTMPPFPPQPQPAITRRSLVAQDNNLSTAQSLKDLVTAIVDLYPPLGASKKLLKAMSQHLVLPWLQHVHELVTSFPMHALYNIADHKYVDFSRIWSGNMTNVGFLTRLSQAFQLPMDHILEIESFFYNATISLPDKLEEAAINVRRFLKEYKELVPDPSTGKSFFFHTIKRFLFNG